MPERVTAGKAPFGPEPAGRFDIEVPDHAVYVEPFPRRVRAVVNGETVIDGDKVLLVHETGSLPRCAFPATDVRIPDEPEKQAEGHLSVEWGAVDAWYEEDERVEVIPATRITASTPSRPHGGSPSASTARSLPNPRGPRRCTRRASRSVTTCRPRTCAWTCSSPADHDRMSLQGHCPALERHRRREHHRGRGLGVPPSGQVRREAEPVQGHLAFCPHRVDLTVEPPADKP